ncbi:ABC transporter permease subunit [Falsibacillus albus]|uniref:ABC transporter permease subunit n=1 Tax=Falsibacillus albus TaxID=2478915 RepID=A0A3L7JQU8_9BACI|nr:ABC transporter permease subunit [Falsibacillus albus]RLQ93198.1 ABC transporter permease subunit [Falsibacillus albus]
MNKSLIFGLLLLGLLIITAITAPYLPFVDASMKEHVMKKKADGGFELPPFPPSKDYPIGSDPKGRDLLSKVLLGTKDTLLTVLGIVLIRYLLAIPLGLSSFYFKSMRYFLLLWNRLFSYMPPIFFVVFIVGLPFIVFSSNRALWYIFIIAIVDVGRVAELFYSTMLDVSKRPYVEAGIVSGCTSWSMLRRYYWPPLQPHIFIQFFSDIGKVIFLLGQLGVVSYFISVEFVSQLGGSYEALNTSNIWPVFFNRILDHIWSHPWYPLTGAAAIGISIFAFSMVSSGLQEYFDRKHKRFRGVDL